MINTSDRQVWQQKASENRRIVQFLPKRPMKRGKLQVFYQYHIFSRSAFDVTTYPLPNSKILSQKCSEKNLFFLRFKKQKEIRGTLKIGYSYLIYYLTFP